MILLIKNITVIDAASSYHMQCVDILIRDGIISDISKNIASEKNVIVYDGSGKHISAGWFDMRVNFCEPGNEHKEDLHSGCEAAAAGGFTDVLLMPSTQPPIDNKAQVEFIKNKAQELNVEIHIAGCMTAKREGQELAELNDMKQAGAIAFTDDKRAINNLHLMQIISTYAKNIVVPIIHFCEEKSLTHTVGVNESATTTSLGFKGTPSLSEEMAIQRTLSIAEYTNTPIHISCISTSNSVDLIRQAKAKKIMVTCDVAIHNLILDDAHIKTFDANFKVVPPMRSKKDIDALIEGLKDGTIDCIVSDHTPQDMESKRVEFEFALPGIIGTQILFGLAHTYLYQNLTLDVLLQKITSNPRNILKLQEITIEKNMAAKLTIFDKDAEWIVTENNLKSKSKNTPFIGWRLKGRPLAIVNKNKFSEV